MGSVKKEMKMQYAHPAPSHLRGFTLIELMIVVAIVGILAAAALPLYNDYVRRSRIVEATSALADARTRMERYYLDNRTYVGGCQDWSTKSFKVGCDGAPTATTYSLKGEGAANGMAGFEYTVNQDNVRTSKGPGDWGSNGSCWLTRKGGECG
jgi:type IV pilus assembly protein PilE